MNNKKLIILILFLISSKIYGNKLDFSKLVYPDVGKAISRLETGNYTSHLYKVHNNLFGMKVGRYGKVNGKTKKGYAKYSSKIQSIADYAAYEAKLIKRYKITSQKQYIAVVSKKYAKNPHYKKLLRKQLNNGC